MSALYPTIITQPWANGTTDPANVVLPPVTADPNKANQVDGFPVSQETDPNVGGEYIKRNEMNGIFKLYSQILNYMNQGGQITFDSVVASSGGYDLNTILYCAADNTFQRSLINGNVADFNSNPNFRNDGVNWSTDISVGAITAGSISSTGDITSSNGGFTGFKNGWNVELGQSTTNGLRVRTTTTNVGISLYTTVANISGISFEDYNNTSASNLEIVDVPGSRIKMVTSQGINSPLVVQSDFTINQVVIGNTIFLVRRDRMVDRYHYHLSGRIIGTQAGAAWTSTLSMGTLGIDYTKIIGTFTGVATFEVTADTNRGQSLGYAKATNASPNLELYVTVTGNIASGSIAVFSLDFTVAF
jgi:hypothetical protein